MVAKGLVRSARVRLLIVAAAVVSISLTALLGQLASAQSTSPTSAAGSSKVKPTVVLVHGAWADASSWEGVINRLQRDGYTVVAPPNPLRGVPEDSGYISNYLKTIAGPIVLVGHSYGGVVITNAATGKLNVKALVYVDAFIPDQGQFVGELIGSQSCLAGSAVDPSQLFNFVQDPALPPGDFDAYLKIEATSLYPGFAKCFANGLSAQRAAELAATQRPAALGVVTDQTGVPAWKTIPSWALIGTADNVIPEAQQTMMATHANARIRHFNAGHLGLISQPDAVEDIILTAIRATS
jgi:pimeloyl-ACP methyl ester carboxylesterase